MLLPNLGAPLWHTYRRRVGRRSMERPSLDGACIACVSGFAAEVPVGGPTGNMCCSRLVFVPSLWAISDDDGLCFFRHLVRRLCVDLFVVAGLGLALSGGDCGSWRMNILEKWNLFLCRVLAATARDRQNAVYYAQLFSRLWRLVFSRFFRQAPLQGQLKTLRGHNTYICH